MNIGDGPDDFFASLYADFNRRDVPAVLALLSPEVEWANGWEGGHVTGRAAVEDYWRRQWAELDPKVVPDAVAETGNGRYAVTVSQEVRDLAGAVIHEGKVIHLYSTEAGLISRMEIQELT